MIILIFVLEFGAKIIPTMGVRGDVNVIRHTPNRNVTKMSNVL